MAGFVAVLAACADSGRDDAGARSASPTSVLLITLDTTRWDAPGFALGRAGLTPTLDRLAAESVAYDWARTVAPVTLPSHASILTGLTPLRHRIRTNGRRRLPAEALTIAERAQAAGMRTGAFVSAVVLDASFGLDQGFEVYDQPKRPARVDDSAYAERSAAATLSGALAWLSTLEPAEPFFLWVHLFDPHEPYTAPAEFVQRAETHADPEVRRTAVYQAEVAFVDAELGRFFAELRRLGRDTGTLVALTADHGEALGAHGEGTHGPLAYDTTMRVPLLLRYPTGADGARFRAGERSGEIVSVVDLYPTFVEALGLGAPGDVDGMSLYHRRMPEDRGVYFESYYGFVAYGWSPLAGWADTQGKYIHSPRPELYRTASDVDETTNLLEQGAPADAYREAIARHAREPTLSAGEQVSGTILDDIEKLGYAGASGEETDDPGPLDELDRPAPLASLPELYETVRALQLQNAGRYEQAIALHRKILASNPHNYETQERLGFCLLRTGEHEEAAELFAAYLAVHPENATVRQNYAAALYTLGRKDDALANWLLALESDPEHAESLHFTAELLRERGRDAEAAELEARLARAYPNAVKRTR